MYVSLCSCVPLCVSCSVRVGVFFRVQKRIRPANGDCDCALCAVEPLNNENTDKPLAVYNVLAATCVELM